MNLPMDLVVQEMVGLRFSVDSDGTCAGHIGAGGHLKFVDGHGRTYIVRGPTTKEFTVPADIVCHLNGMPFELPAGTVIRMQPNNYKLALSQSAHSLLNPAQADSPAALTSNLSD